ncbi:RraA family protein [Psychromarinibacter halotolerans]|uniref:Putative 4-hydroxy-4-methyl-2-oxoglutarate aldolase n=1 Tax=Psychromarinibacter halotolerans TaxID=1775175 RepID=A0ABV7H089_9RHOB|nr:RraA family protein [Psychromarinibacter halotolerans]MDF0598792.1 RraA family protein [Psychromarinibacter halotolerans]
MIEEPPLLTIRRPTRRPTDAQIAAFQGVPSSFVVDAMYGDGALPPVIRALDPEYAAAGPALTVEAGPADILAVLAALPQVRDGDVVVSDFGGHQGCAAAGDRVCAFMKNSGAIGFITDGPMRDILGIKATGLAVWCTGLTPGSPFAKGPGRVGFPITLGGRAIETGDMIVADRDGIAVVPFDRIDEVIEMLAKVTELENSLDAELQKGLKVPENIVELLASDQVKYV